MPLETADLMDDCLAGSTVLLRMTVDLGLYLLDYVMVETTNHAVLSGRSNSNHCHFWLLSAY